MDHGVINSQSHMMVLAIADFDYNYFFCIVTVATVPGRVNFIVQLQLTNIYVIWQV